jgi:predicted RNase H-like HicB family nuclease
MNLEEIIKIYEEMVEEFGDKLPSMEHEPLRFAYYVRLYMYNRSIL